LRDFVIHTGPDIIHINKSKIRWAENVASMREKGKCISNFDMERMKSIGRPRLRWEDSSMDQNKRNRTEGCRLHKPGSG
jgi:hypothetical protein